MTRRETNLLEALERIAHKLMVMAIVIESLGEGFEDAAVQMRGEAAIAFEAAYQARQPQ